MMVVVTNDDQWSMEDFQEEKRSLPLNKKKQLPSQEHYMKSKYEEKRLRHLIR